MDVKRYFVYLGYTGKNYCGWQSQPNGVSVQETIEKALSLILRTPTTIVGAGRTDAGVNARTMIAHFDCETDFDNQMLASKLNSVLPKDIAIYRIVEVKPNAHARFDAQSRKYKYYITTEKDPFDYRFKCRIFADLDLEAMNKCADILFEYHDFTSFSKLHTDVKTNNCKIMYAQWQKTGSQYVFTIKADRFLRNMVRSIVGTLLDVGRGKLDEHRFRQIIEAKDRCKAGSSAPGNALFLEEVEYNEDLFLE